MTFQRTNSSNTDYTSLAQLEVATEHARVPFERILLFEFSLFPFPFPFIWKLHHSFRGINLA